MTRTWQKVTVTQSWIFRSTKIAIKWWHYEMKRLIFASLPFRTLNWTVNSSQPLQCNYQLSGWWIDVRLSHDGAENRSFSISEFIIRKTTISFSLLTLCSSDCLLWFFYFTPYNIYYRIHLGHLFEADRQVNIFHHFPSSGLWIKHINSFFHYTNSWSTDKKGDSRDTYL